MSTLKMYIDGEWILNINNRTRKIISPINQQEIALVTEGDRNYVDDAVKAAKRAISKGSEWRNITQQEKVYLLNKIADLIEERSELLAKTETINTGRLYKETISDDVMGAAYEFRNYAGILSEISGKTHNQSSELFSFSIREPIGVCGIIVPWNYPLMTASSYIAATLAAGNSIIVKPSSYTPLTTILLFEILEEVGLPRGVVNLVLGSGEEVGNTLATHEDLDMLIFTGSTETGIDILRNSRSIKKMELELGGKSPIIVFDDIDLDVVVDNIMFTAFLSQGQVCVAGSRLLVQDTIYKELIDKLVKKTKKIRLGDPMNKSSQMGPICTKSHMEKILAYVKSGLYDGARLACGGKRMTVEGLEDGFYIEPTIFVDCKQNMKIVKEEIFGPVLTVQSFNNESEAICMANDTKYGLTAQIYTDNIQRAIRVSDSIEAGMIWVNTYLESNGGCSVNPYKQSGIGTIGGLDGLIEFTKSKLIHIRTEPKKTNWFGDFTGN
ncbi:aldehyde dehydrogenase family protein [Asaccharospora irregularis]|uniref:Aldehyde dehydrogenase (Acceptor) n=1 Tax=Asaccharospora irregularis DSM 2635 TaxID=1121321 RepID=A0A1M5MG72_9FIRM|nr:aldehyde dehydrogenase family protein [Asaccharospora irregularis]SHG76414.1 aldehyde dehydrogenase (acceptor) [Asaccharospora irregularis DSM 2635]